MALLTAHTTTAIGIGGVGVLLLLLVLNRRSGSAPSAEAYASLNHVFLNVTEPRTEWLNMGLWEQDDKIERDRSIDFPAAAKALAMRVLQPLYAAENRIDKVLDVGHACGDSLLLIHDTLKPVQLHGVTSMELQARRAQARTGNTAKVWCADAVEHLSTSTDSYDAIVAIDCAYHFTDRENFLKLASRRLKPGGHLLLFDLVAAFPYPQDDSWFTATNAIPRPTQRPSWSNRLKHEFICLATSSLSKNFVSASVYADQLREAGFRRINIEDVSHRVFPGFSRFLQGLGVGAERAWRGGSWMQHVALRSFGSVVERWAQGGDVGTVRGVIVHAAK